MPYLNIFCQHAVFLFIYTLIYNLYIFVLLRVASQDSCSDVFCRLSVWVLHSLPVLLSALRVWLTQKCRGSVSSSGWWECFAVTRWLSALNSVASERFTARVLRYIPSAEHRPGPASFLLLSLSHTCKIPVKHIHCLFLCIPVLGGWLFFFLPRFAMKMHKTRKFPDWMAMHMQVCTTIFESSQEVIVGLCACLHAHVFLTGSKSAP